MFQGTIIAAFYSLAAMQEVTPQAAGQQLYLFAYPLVLMDVTKDATGGVDPNRFTHTLAFPDAAFRAIVRPNADTLYSTARLDLSKEPALVFMPETKGRYYMLQVLDAWTETVDVPGKRTTGTESKWFAITGPQWEGKLPANVHRIASATNFVWLLGRVQTNGPADYRNVHAIQRGMKLMPLSRYPDGSAVRMTPASPGRGAGLAGLTPPQLVDRMSDVEFFNRFLSLLAKNPAHPADREMMQRIAALGWKPGERIESLPGAAFAEGVQAGRKLLGAVEFLRTTSAGASGWTGVNPNVGRYGTNYLARAVVARLGLGANPPEDAVYLSAYKDSFGKPLDSAKGYRLHFPKDRLPPVEAFWSIALYDPNGYFAANPIGRYSIGDRDPLVRNEDGSLDIYIQRAEPEVKANWLPAPAEGSFNLTLRLYWPRTEILNGQWTPPPVLPLPSK